MTKEELLRRLRRDMLAEFRHHILREEPHRLTLPGAVRAAPVQPGHQLALSHQLHPQFAADDPGSALQAFDRCAAVLGIEQAIDLRTTRLHQLGHALLGDFLLFHFSGELMGDNGFDRRGRDFFADSFLVQPALKAGAYMRVFLCHD